MTRERRDHEVKAMVTASQYVAIQYMAEHQQVSMSAYIAQAVVDQVNRDASVISRQVLAEPVRGLGEDEL